MKEKTILNRRQQIDRNASIQALELLKKLKLPKILDKLDYEVIFSQEKSLYINNVDIIVAPEIIIRATYNGSIVYGAVKIHISKGKPFNLNQSTYVATTIYSFLSKKVAKKNEKVLPEICLCLDVFAERLTPAPANISSELSQIRAICGEIKELWTLT